MGYWLMGWPKSLSNLPLKQHKLVDRELTRWATLNLVNDEPQAGQDQPAPLRLSTHTTMYQLPWRYQNFALQQNNTSPNAFDVWDGLHNCLHLMVGMHNAFGKTLYLNQLRSVIDKQNLVWMGTPLIWCLWWIFGWGEWAIGHFVWAQLLTTYKPNSQLLLRDSVSVWIV